MRDRNLTQRHWEWKSTLPIVISCLALFISLMTYLLAVERDNEARELALMSRQLEMILNLDRMKEAIIQEMEPSKDDPIRLAYLRAGAQEVEDLRAKVKDLKFEGVSTRGVRRDIEAIYARIIIQVASLTRRSQKTISSTP